MRGGIPDPASGLVEAVKKGQLVPIVGSGLSIAAGGPTWEELVLGIATEAQGTGQAAELKAALKAVETGRLLDAANVLENILGTEFRPSVVRKIQHRLEVVLEKGPKLRPRGTSTPRNMEPTPAHRLLAQLNPRAVVTTNYDTLIEQAFHDLGKDVPSVSRSNPHLAQKLQEGNTFILKLHGDVHNKEDIVLARRDYAEVIFDHQLRDVPSSGPSPFGKLLEIGCVLDEDELCPLRTIARHQ